MALQAAPQAAAFSTQPKRPLGGVRDPGVTFTHCDRRYWHQLHAMDQMPPTEEAKRTFAEAFEYWRDVEAWADVNPSRRAAPGDPVAPAVVSITYHWWDVRMALPCPDSNPCTGTVNVLTSSGATLFSKSVELQSDGSEVIALALSHRSARALQHLRVEVAQP